MQITYNLLLIVLLNFVGISQLQAQCDNWQSFEMQAETFTNPALGIAITVEKDKVGKPFVYVAYKDAGLHVYTISDEENPALVKKLDVVAFGDLDVINLYQVGEYLYASLGDIWSTEEVSGFAIIDVSNPHDPIVTDQYELMNSEGGAGDIKIVGKYAYLASMQNGLLILDISNKGNIQFVGQLILDNSFPHQNPGKSGLFNARGLDIQGNYAYVCYDRGALRVIDISDRTKPLQVNQYCIPDLIDHATAYNNIVVQGDVAYVSIDYYGVEILDIADPLQIKQVALWHPESWSPPTNNLFEWLNANGHANELVLDTTCQRLYVAAGKSDVVAIDVSIPSVPQACEIFGSTDDNYGTWGLDYFEDHVYAAYIWAPITPPLSNFTGFRIIKTGKCSTTAVENPKVIPGVQVSPNPFSEQFQLQFEENKNDIYVQLFNSSGQLIQEQNFSHRSLITISLQRGVGLFYLKVFADGLISCHKVVQSSE